MKFIHLNYNSEPRIVFSLDYMEGVVEKERGVTIYVSGFPEPIEFDIRYDRFIATVYSDTEYKEYELIDLYESPEPDIGLEQLAAEA